MNWLYFKALHLIFVVTWFAGLFYIVRLFVYLAEANCKPEPERSILMPQFRLMQRRLWYGITVPSALMVAVFGFGMLFWYPLTGWLMVKLGLVAGLFGYHFFCHFIFAQQQKGIFKYGSDFLRVWNEVATIFLIGIVFLVVLKSALSMLWGLLGLFALMIVLFGAIKVYKYLRTKNKA